jgi:hypothetical protein
LEVKMRTVKSLAMIALLFGGTSLAIAQSGPPTGGQPPVAGGAAGNPANPGPPGPGVMPGGPGPSVQSAAPSPYLRSAAPPTGAATTTRVAHHHMNKHHKHMYMSAKGMHHKTLKTGQQLTKQPTKQ